MGNLIPESFTAGEIIGSWVGVILVIAIILGVMLGLWVKFIQPNVDVMATPQNMQRIATERGTSIELANNALSIVKTPLRALDNSRNFLINQHVLATTGSGYIGPPMNGVYSEARAVQLALQSGVRCFVFDIEELKEKPRLITKKSNGVRVCLNNGYLNKALCSSNMTAFSSMIGAVQNTWENDPLIFYLRFKKEPSRACAQEVADSLYRIRNYILRGNAKGEFNHRKSESQLFFLNNEDLTKKIIILSNIDTGPYNSRTAQGAKPNLDFYVHGRVYNKGSNQTDVNTRYAFEVSIPYIMGLDDNATSDMVKNTRVAWHILINDDINHKYTKEEINKARACGIQAIAGYVFEDILSDADTVRESSKRSGNSVAKERNPLLQVFRQDNKHGAFIPKKTEHQYVRPGQVTVESAPREFNSNGGMLSAPKL